MEKLLTDCYTELHDEGFGLILLHKPEKPSKQHPKGRGKEPVDTAWPDLGVVKAVRARLAGWNIGLKIGKHHVIADWDPRNGDPRADLAPLSEWEIFPRVLTPGGGVHYYMRIDAALGEKPFGRPGLDIKALGGQVLAPYCVHPNGGMYEWDLSSPPLSEIPDMPSWLAVERTQLPSTDRAIDVDRLALALKGADIMAFRDHDKWFRMMCACHEATNGSGLEQFVSWCVRDELYASDEEQIRYRWNTLGRKNNVRAGVGTLNRLLLSVGAEGIPDEIPSAFADMAVVNAPLVSSLAADDMRKTNPVKWLTESGHCIVGNGGKTYAAYKRYGEWCFSSRYDFLIVSQTEYGLKSVVLPPKEEGDEEKTMPAGRFWFDYAKKPVYAGIGYEPHRTEVPAETSDGKLNTWTGYGAKPVKGDWSMYKRLLLETGCKGNAGLYEYVLNWMATVLQNPGWPCGVALVLQGGKGIGKTSVTSRFMRLFGRHSLAVTSKEQLLGRFNAHLEGKSLIVASEAFWAGSKAGESMLKSLITDIDITYERKGMTPYSGRNCVNMMINSNEEWVVPASMDERRFCVLDFRDDKRDAGWWKSFHSSEKIGLEAMMYDLMERDISGFNIHIIPQTEGLAKQKRLSMGLVEEWLYEIADSGDWATMGCIEYKVGYEGHQRSCYLVKEVLEAFDAHDRRHTVSSTSFGVLMNKFIPGLKKSRITNPVSELMAGPKQVGVYVFPPIEILRKSFNID